MNNSNNLTLKTELMEDNTNILTRTFYDFGNALTKNVQIDVDGPTLDKMKDNEYKMCFAKKVGTFNYNVVWQSYSDYMEKNSFSWLPMYSIFGTNTFKENMEVSVKCLPVDIGLGMTTTLSKNGRLSKPVTGGPETAFTMINEYGEIHPGVNQLSTGLNMEQISTPIYVSEKAAVSGKIELTPVEKVLIWFEQNIKTGTMFSSARSKEIEVDMTFKNEVNLMYNGNWNIV